jgi:peptidoglycan hydrolase-like protein with peptidoglycan-binding domain
MTDSQVAAFLAANGLDADSRLYRHSLPEYLSSTDDGGHRISANADPSEAVTNVYGQGHVELAVHVGPGLSFSESPENSWKDAGRICVELRLADVLEQGGRVYPVESIATERVWYVTLPEGSVRVRVVDS